MSSEQRLQPFYFAPHLTSMTACVDGGPHDFSGTTRTGGDGMTIAANTPCTRAGCETSLMEVIHVG